jgi:large subunit ribosomal protein L24e
MVRIYKCSFCGKEIEPGTGMTKVIRDTVQRFCSRKCRKSNEMKRDPRKFKWTTKYEKKIH